MTPRAVFFDLDNTLVHRAHSLACYAAQFSADFAEQLAPLDEKQLLAVLLDADNGGYLRPDSSFASIKDCVTHALLHRVPWQSAISETALRSHWALYSAALNVPMPGAAELIAELTRRQLRIGVISNGAQDSRKIRVASLPFHAQIDIVVSSGELGIKKPDARLFHHAAAALGVAPQACLYIGDHPVNDVLGAHAAGMSSIWLRGFHAWPESQPAPQASVAHLADIIPLLQSQA